MRAWAIGVCLLLPACIELGVYRCAGGRSCEGGTCEPTGYCSYEDEACPSGRRYSELAAGALARACVDDEMSSSGSESGTSEAICGNGVGEGDEQCDDGDDIDGNGCNVDCRESGSVLWTATFPGAVPGRDTGYAVVMLGSGDVVVGGSEQVAGFDDALLMRLRADDGGEVWSWRRATELEERIEALAINAVGEIVAGGIAIVPEETDTAWMAVLDGGGALLYEDHPAGEIVRGVVGNAGGFIVGGGVQAEDYDGFVASYPEGTQEPFWSVGSALAGDENYVDIERIEANVVFAIVSVADGAEIHRVDMDGVEVVGSVDASILPQGSAFHDPSGGIAIAGYEVTTFANDAWLGLVGPDGGAVWSVRERDVELEVDEEFEDVAVDAEGNVIAAGFRTGDDKDAWVRKYDAAGRLLWTRRFEEPGASVARAVDVDGEGNIAITGEIDGEDGTLDFWVAKLLP